MLNKEEILYNCKSLVYTWFNGLNDIKDLCVEMSGDYDSKHCPCSVSDCHKVMADLLYFNNGKYKSLRLLGVVDGRKKVIGEIDIQ